MPVTKLKKAMCSIGERRKFDLKDWYKDETSDINELRSRLEKLNLVGRTISDIRIVSHCYDMEIDDIEDIVWSRMRGFPKQLQDKLSEFNRIDDYFPFPLSIQIDEPFLIKFEDGDQLEVTTSLEEYFKVSMNEIPWDAESNVNMENINGSILFDLCKGAKIERAEVEVGVDKTGREYIEGVKLSWMHDRCLASMHFVSDCHDFMGVYIEFWDRTFTVPFLKVKQSMYKEYYKAQL